MSIAGDEDKEETDNRDEAIIKIVAVLTLRSTEEIQGGNGVLVEENWDTAG